MNINHTKMTLEINSCKNYEILEVRQGDKDSRIIDFAFTVNGETVNLTSTMTAKVNATVDDVIVADSVPAVVDTKNNVVTVTLTDTMLALSGICKMDIVLTEGDEIITAETVCLRIGKSVINDDSKAFPGASSIVEITKEVKNARGSQNSLGARFDTVDANLTKKANKSDIDSINSRLQSTETTLKNKANIADVSNALTSKANKATTLAGYGITNAYAKTEIDTKLSGKLDNTAGSVTTDNIASKAVTMEKLAGDVTNQLSELKNDTVDLSVGNYIISPNYHSGKIDTSTGEEVAPYDTTRISEKLNFDNYESVNVDSGNKLYFSVFEFDSSGKYIKQIANTLRNYTIIPMNGHLYVLQWWYGDSDDFENRLSYTKVLAKSLLNKKDKEQIYTDLSPKTEVKIDLPDKLFIVKGETIELFKYGMYCTDTEFINNQYNIRVVNINKYTTQYDDKIVISCPKDYSKPILQGDNDLALFQLIDTYGRVIEQKRVKIFVADKATISDIDRNIMYLGDSFTGMGFRTQEIANLIAKESNLTKTKLIGRSIGQGSGNRFTGTGGYSWANYTENPNTLPSAYPNNYLWNPAYNRISMKYLVESLGESHLDYVVILLGWNDYESGAFASSFSWDIMRQRAKRLIENIRNYYPTCKIILESYHYMYPLHRKSYGGALPQVRQNKYIYDLNRFYQEIANEYEYVEFVQMSIQIDVLHNMGFEEEKVNKRSEEIVKYCKDVVHPADIGFYQYSDAEFNALLYLMQ